MRRKDIVKLNIGLAVLIGSLLLIGLLGSATPSRANVINVSAGSSIQTAINSASPGDTIKVQSGTYDENLVISKSLTLEGGYDASFASRTAHGSVISPTAGGLVVTISGNNVAITLDGFEIRGGSDYGKFGAGVHVEVGGSSTVILNGNFIHDNRVTGSSTDNPGRGGGIGASLSGNSVVTLTNNLVMTNTSGRTGGGIWFDLATGTTAHVLSNTLAGNSSLLYGGGMSAEQTDSTLELKYNAVQSNTISHNGGGLYAILNSGAQLNVISNTIAGNDTTTYDGGGLACILDGGSLLSAQSNTFSANHGSRYGGAIYVSGDHSSQVTMQDNQVTHNVAYRGAGIYAQGVNAVAFAVTDNTLQQNQATNRGGGLYVDIADDTSALIRHNYVRGNQSPTYGGIYANGDNRITLQLTHNTVATNTTTSNVAGAYVRVHLSSTLVLTGNTILSNTSGNYYGGLQVNADSFCNVRFTDNTVMSNTADSTSSDLYGGLSYVLSDHSIGDFSRNRVQANQAGNSYGGGYIEVSDLSRMSFNDNIFQDNRAGNDYGGLRMVLNYNSVLSGTTLQVLDNQSADAYGGLRVEVNNSSALTFTQALSCTHNQSGGHHGGGYVYGHYNTRISIAHLYAAYNRSALLGGGIALRGDDHDVLVVPEAQIISNTAGSNGGGLWLYAEYGSEIRLTHSHIVSNTAAGSGGGVYIDTDDHNSVIHLENTSFISNTAVANGGGVAVGSALANVALLHLQATHFISNSAQTGNGGGLHITSLVNHAQAYADQSEFTANQAGSEGGGVYLGSADDSQISFDDAQFQHNIAGTSGGGLYSNAYRYGTEFSMCRATLEHNSAGTSGGAIYFSNAAYHARVTVKDSTFALNHAASRGGAVYAATLANAGSVITFTDNTIVTNTATAGGGGLYFATLAQSGSAILFNRNTLRQNIATNSGSFGGGVYMGSLSYAASVSMQHNEIAQNTSGGSGAGLYLGDTYNASRFDFQNNSIVSNTISSTTAYPGGGFYLTQIRIGSQLTMSNNLIQNNHATGDGGGLYVASGFNSGALIHLRHNQWLTNSAEGKGGAIYLAHLSLGARMTFADNQIAHNSSGGDYGGIYFGDVDHSQLTFAQNDITANHAGLSDATVNGGNGGGVYLGEITHGGLTTFSYNQIISNTAHANGSTGGNYGGLYVGLNDNGLLRMWENTIAQNVAQHAYAGMFTTLKLNSRLLMTHNVISANQATGIGGGLTIVGGDSTSSAFSQYFLSRNQIVANTAASQGGLRILDTVDAAEPLWGRSENNLIADNSDSGLYLSNVDFDSTNDTIANNTGAGVYVSGTITSTINVVNTVLWGNSVLYDHASGMDYSQVLASYSDLQGTDPTYPPGVVNQGHNLCAEPAFASPAAHDYHPSMGSWLRNAGSNTAASATDLDGVPRPVEEHPTIGAYEYRVGGVSLYDGGTKLGRPGTWVTHTVVITNTGTGQDDFALSLHGNWPGYITQPGQTMQLNSVLLDAGAAATLWVYVQVPADAAAGDHDTAQVTAVSQRNALVVGSADVDTEAALASALALTSDSRAATPVKHTQIYLHALQNLGNGEDTFNLTAQNSLGWVAAVRPANLTLAAGAAAVITVSVQVPDAVGQTNVTTITATSLDGTATATSHDRTTAVPSSTVAFLTLNPPRGATASAGTAHVYTHTLANRSTQPDTVTLAALSGFGWPVAVTPGSIVLPARSSGIVSLTVTLPLTAPRDAIELTTLLATSASDPNVQASLQDATTVYRPSDLALSANEQQLVPVGTSHTYTHTLTNRSPLDDEVSLSAASSRGWPVIITPTHVSLSAGVTTCVTVTVTVPADALHGQSDHTIVTALSANDSRAVQQDDLIVAQRPFALGLTPDRAATVSVDANDAPQVYTHTLTNSGSQSDAVVLSVSSSQGWPVSVSPASVTLAGGASATITVTVTVPGGTATGETDFAQVTATSGNDGRSATVYDVTTAQRPATLALSPAEPAAALGGTVQTYHHTITNSGSLADHVSFAADSSRGWTVNVTPAALDLAAGAHAPLTVTLTLPADGANGLVDVTQLQARSQNAAQVAAVAVDVTTLLNPDSLALAADQSLEASANHSAVYQHTLTNHGARMDTFLCNAVSAQGWTANVAPPVVTLAPGEATTLTLTVAVPDAATGTTDTITITAISSYGTEARVSNTDTLLVTGGRSSIYLPLVLRNK